MSKERLIVNHDDPPGYQSLYPPEVTISHTNGETITTVVNDTIDLKNTQTHVYKRRWYILMAYSLLAFTQGGLWNTWGPIADSTEDAFGWTDGDIALLSNWGPISYILAAFILSWIVDVKGLRLACLSTAFLVAAGAGIRCITDKSPYIKWSVNFGQFLNGLAGPVAFGVPPALSALWFQADQRTTATAIAASPNGIGIAVSFLIGPYMVPKPPDDNVTMGTNSSNVTSSPQINTDLDRTNKERNDIMMLMYVEAAWSLFVFLLILIYFPTKPPKPPSLSASIERIDFSSGAKALLRNKGFWIICLTYGISLGVFNCWQSVLDVNLKPHNISENEAGWIGFYSILAGAFAAVCLAKLSDSFSRHMKLFLILLYVGGAACFVWFTLLVQGTLPNSTISLYISVILGSLLLNSSAPLYFEMACEITYPVSEGITNFVLTLVNNVGGLIFLSIQMIPHIGTSWENWCALGAIVVTIPVLLLIKENYRRLNIDESKTQ